MAQALEQIRKLIGEDEDIFDYYFTNTLRKSNFGIDMNHIENLLLKLRTKN